MDIRTISATDFYRYQTISGINKKRYDDLIATYSCFTSSSSFHVVKKYNKNATYNIKRVHKDIKRSLMGLLNIINTENYKIIFEKVKFLIKQENLNTIIVEILHKSCLQVFYLHVFTRLIKDIINICGISEKKTIYDTICLYVSDFLQKREYIFKCDSTVEVEPYAMFCMIQKHKMLIQNKNILIVEMFKNSLITDMNVEQYISFIFGELQTSYENELHMDILVQILLDIGRENTLTGYVILFDKEKMLSVECNKKLTFMRENLMRMISH